MTELNGVIVLLAGAGPSTVEAAAGCAPCGEAVAPAAGGGGMNKSPFWPQPESAATTVTAMANGRISRRMGDFP